MARFSSFSMLGAAALVALACAAAGEPAGDLLAPARTLAEIGGRLGKQPLRCTAIDATSKLCEWQLGNGDGAWSALARSVDTGYRVSVICAVPTDGAARAPGSCAVVPCVSEREGWAVPFPGAGQKGWSSPAQIQVARERLAARARTVLDEARTLAELSRLVGAVPAECRPLDPQARLCTWHATSRTRGHGLLAALISAPKRKKVRLLCTLPADDGARAADSCKVEIDE